ncbi:MAG: 1-acyl-sn-glycerol-3-phosphate acyltransferase [Planctomycetaceae bacterium]|nr:1-acyl-sn-glycerol-3-phosphate acyltransferase [Planctomycetaceae bacterium]
MTAAPATPTTQALGSPLRRNWVWLTCQTICRLVFAIWLRFRARGIERLPATGGALLLGNHQSFLDPLLVGLPLDRPVSYLARDTLFSIPFVGWILRHTYVVPLNRDAGGSGAIRETLSRMEQGFLVGVFPEGTRSADGTLGPFKPGFAALVRRTNLPIYPIGIAGANRALGRGSLWIKPRRVCVVFGEPLDPEQIAPLKQRGREEELVEAVRARIAACQVEAEQWLQGTRRPEV